MFYYCANPDCLVPFDYQGGHVFRFHKHHAPGEPPPNTHSVQHFWLCGACSLMYTLDYRDDMGVLIRFVPGERSECEQGRLIAAA